MRVFLGQCCRKNITSADHGRAHDFISQSLLGGRFGYFLFFFCLGRGGLESEAAGRGGVDFLLKIPEGGVSRRGRGRGAGRVSASNWGFLGGG